MKKKITILGSTGSVGTQALKVIDMHPALFSAAGLAAGNNCQLLLEQIKKYRPAAVSVNSIEALKFLKKEAPRNLKIYYGEKGLITLATQPEVHLVLVAIPGVAALLPTIEAIKKKKDIAIASKEIMVAAGDLIRNLAKINQVRLLPVDSEHSAIFQCLKNEPVKNVKRIILTASGGPFFNKSRAFLQKVTARQALRHPTWNMGQKVTIDSSTLMNKGLEVIEAHHLFCLPYEKIEVVIHPESIIHSMVEFVDGSCLAQLSKPDMTLPIQQAFSDPERLNRPHQKLPLKNLNFFEPDLKKFPCLKLAYQAGKAGGTCGAVLNAANEIAVAAFLKDRLPYLQIPEVVAKVLSQHQGKPADRLSAIIEADRWAREQARILINSYGQHY